MSEANMASDSAIARLKGTQWFKDQQRWVEDDSYSRMIWYGKIRAIELAKDIPGNRVDVIELNELHQAISVPHYAERQDPILLPPERRKIAFKDTDRMPLVGETWAFACHSNSKGIWYIHSAYPVIKSVSEVPK